METVVHSIKIPTLMLRLTLRSLPLERCAFFSALFPPRGSLDGIQAQEYQLGNLIRSKYFDPASPSYIRGIRNSSSLLDYDQVLLEADASDEGYVILDSAVALSQGLWPASLAETSVLSNGTTISSPLGGYQ